MLTPFFGVGRKEPLCVPKLGPRCGGRQFNTRDSYSQALNKHRGAKFLVGTLELMLIHGTGLRKEYLLWGTLEFLKPMNSRIVTGLNRLRGPNLG